ncbi:hypothetical protein HNQ91_003205 [Filimonas zeae]|uniref:ATP-binding protein n=1 Tax=Filimonas zeae TaxID=1737353 RepID=UPI002865B4B0|nr:ATP-binding protein [Filimonas zeae]MDR6340140.1 hypothetical protein [Filimonas zeae]
MSVTRRRQKIKLKKKWFDEHFKRSFDQEIQSKYNAWLYQTNRFEREELLNILNFAGYLQTGLKLIESAKEALEAFNKKYQTFLIIIDREGIKITNKQHPFTSNTAALFEASSSLQVQLQLAATQLNRKGYDLLNHKASLKPLDYLVIGDADLGGSAFLDKQLVTNRFLLSDLRSLHSKALSDLEQWNKWVHRFHQQANYKIISGNAGTGKTNTSAYLAEQLHKSGEFVIFLKAWQFSGDNTVLENVFFRLLEVPPGYTLREFLEKLQTFSKNRKKRCFIIIDALNETTRSTTGFSKIWHYNLQSFINDISQFSNVYFICTLRTSYIKQIWHDEQPYISMLQGFDNEADIKDACLRYFSHYRISPQNFNEADLTPFQVPLFLDLFCRMANGDRLRSHNIMLDASSYASVFKQYVARLVNEVQQKRELATQNPIREGLYNSGQLFWTEPQGLAKLDEFVIAFDKTANIQTHISIAFAMLDGNLIFIRDASGRSQEIVRHTQQEVGGYLLASWLTETYPNANDLINSPLFQKNLLRSSRNPHQLRLDIIKFLVALKPDIITAIDDEDIVHSAWWFLYNGYQSVDGVLPSYLLKHWANLDIMEQILSTSKRYWLDTSNQFNFNYIASMLMRLRAWDLDLTWNLHIYKNADAFYQMVEHSIEIIRNGEASEERIHLWARHVAFISVTNIRKLRELTAVFLLEYGKQYPTKLADLTVEYFNLADSYITQTLTQCIYGVALILQNDTNFINDHLKSIAQRLYMLQFDPDSKNAVFDYIITDSIKHLLDLAIHKKVWEPEATIAGRIREYKTAEPSQWPIANERTREFIDEHSSYSDLPEPIKMDFSIYTIPRLFNNHERQGEGIVQVYTRIIDLGFEHTIQAGSRSVLLEDFYHGSSLDKELGRVDRLGKKYCWRAFFDYAGYLLQNGELSVFGHKDEGLQYSRLSDIDYDISLPKTNYKIRKRLYKENLLAQHSTDKEWYNQVVIDSIQPLIIQNLEADTYVMVNGDISQKLDESYNVRSSLMVDAFFIRKNDNTHYLKAIIKERVFEWTNDMEIRDNLRHVYFGELYWADTMPTARPYDFSIPNGEIEVVQHIVEIEEAMLGIYDFDQVGQIVDQELRYHYNFETLPVVAYFLWESPSDIFPGQSDYFPSVDMGKQLFLKANPLTCQILDADLKACYQSIDLEEEHFDNTFNYMRKDLLDKYMLDNNLALLYRVKQHSYDTDRMHNRKMKYFLYEQQ